LQSSSRKLQKTSRTDFVWAAIPDYAAKPGTVMGPYNLQLFIFFPFVRYPATQFVSADMWVDRPAGRVYVVSGGKLLRLPFDVEGEW